MRNHFRKKANEDTNEQRQRQVMIMTLLVPKKFQQAGGKTEVVRSNVKTPHCAGRKEIPRVEHKMCNDEREDDGKQKSNNKNRHTEEMTKLKDPSCSSKHQLNQLRKRRGLVFL
ncbi:uncharacterized protein LOC113307587 isoform X1 [Papaver somniferum]|uniref:uncharacterized protein LOC113307587 isoform X1 n=1 Tax=Papaver somniferum TaxID=3469 RepID=UPI000E70261E|nr:uncharacterized protein LOC113307587 isoform X1 [Papaver somniferum]